MQEVVAEVEAAVQEVVAEVEAAEVEVAAEVEAGAEEPRRGYPSKDSDEMATDQRDRARLFLSPVRR